jgi:hypothetical protein
VVAAELLLSAGSRTVCGSRVIEQPDPALDRRLSGPPPLPLGRYVAVALGTMDFAYVYGEVLDVRGP